MILRATSDTSGAARVYEITARLEAAFPAVEAAFPNVDLSIVLCFRCLPDAFERRTFRRYAKAENTLYLDMNFSEDVFGTLDEDEQERRVAAFLLGYLEQSLAKYRFRDLDVARFMAVFTDRIREIGWGSVV